MQSFALSVVIAVIFAMFGAGIFDVGSDVESKRFVLIASAAVGFALYWVWVFGSSFVASVRSSKNHYQAIFKIGAFWCAGGLFSLMMRSIFNTVPLDEYLKVGVSIVCWIGIATTYLAYRRAADHPIAIAPEPKQPSAPDAVPTAENAV